MGFKVKSKDGLEIYSDETSYSKISKKLILIGNVVIIDTNNNIKIKSDNIEYNKKLEFIISKDETFVNIDDKYDIKSENFSFLRSKNIIKSNKKTTLKDKISNKVETNNFIYFLIQKNLYQKICLLPIKMKINIFQKNLQ